LVKVATLGAENFVVVLEAVDNTGGADGDVDAATEFAEMVR